MKTADLVGIARRINDREEVIEKRKARTVQEANETCCEVVLQGRDLIAVKTALKHGRWLDWLAVNCPKISERTAQLYMRIASHPQKAALLEQGVALRAVGMLVCDADPAEAKGEEAKRWPPYLEAIGRLSKLCGYVERFPIDQWPNEGLDKFRSELQPIAQRLWPDKFGS